MLQHSETAISKNKPGMRTSESIASSISQPRSSAFPYQSKLEFLNDNYTFFKKYLSDTSSEYFDYHINCAWEIYKTTIHYRLHNDDQSITPILYRASDHSFVETTEWDLLLTYNSSKRTYRPIAHTLATNMSWILAHIHAGNTFRIVSPFYTITQEERVGDCYSTFAHEVTAVMNAGYQVASCLSPDNHIFLTPKLSPQKYGLHLALRHIDPCKDKIELAFNHLTQRKDFLQGHYLDDGENLDDDSGDSLWDETDRILAKYEVNPIKEDRNMMSPHDIFNYLFNQLYYAIIQGEIAQAIEFLNHKKINNFIFNKMNGKSILQIAIEYQQIFIACKIASLGYFDIPAAVKLDRGELVITYKPLDSLFAQFYFLIMNHTSEMLFTLIVDYEKFVHIKASNKVSAIEFPISADDQTLTKKQLEHAKAKKAPLKNLFPVLSHKSPVLKSTLFFRPYKHESKAKLLPIETPSYVALSSRL